MHLVVVPPGASAEPHYHEGYETAIYQLEGRVETRYGDGLEQSVVTEAGDFLFVPPGVPHQAVNLSETEPAVAIIARNDANEQERVVRTASGSGLADCAQLLAQQETLAELVVRLEHELVPPGQVGAAFDLGDHALRASPRRRGR